MTRGIGVRAGVWLSVVFLTAYLPRHSQVGEKSRSKIWSQIRVMVN